MSGWTDTADTPPPAWVWVIARNIVGFEMGCRFDGVRWRDGEACFMRAPRQWRLWDPLPPYINNRSPKEQQA